MSTENNNVKLIATAIIVAAIVVAGALVYQPGQHVPPAPVATPATSLDDDAVLGGVDVPVTMVVFGDYQCPYCKQAFSTAEAQVRKDYVDTGKVKMVFRDYPLEFHPFAIPAAEAAECAHAQGKYWEYHDALYAAQDQLATIDYGKLAGDLKLDTKTFKNCVDGHTYANEIELDRQAGIALGVTGTPATFINGKLIPGAYPYATYKAAIEAALKAAK